MRLSVTVGRTFVSTQTIQERHLLQSDVHFGNEETIGLNYSRLLKTQGFLDLSRNSRRVYRIDMDLNAGQEPDPEGLRGAFS